MGDATWVQAAAAMASALAAMGSLLVARETFRRNRESRRRDAAREIDEVARAIEVDARRVASLYARLAVQQRTLAIFHGHNAMSALQQLVFDETTTEAKRAADIKEQAATQAVIPRGASDDDIAERLTWLRVRRLEIRGLLEDGAARLDETRVDVEAAREAHNQRMRDVGLGRFNRSL